jgi:hypothetical protein
MNRITAIFLALFLSFGYIYSQDGTTNGPATNGTESTNLPAMKAIPALTYGHLIGAEFAGLLLPGTGAAHFIIGDTRDGFLTLGASACSVLIYAGAQLLLQNGTIDSPWVYNPLHYGSMLLFASAYLFDMIGTYTYYTDFNNNLKISSKVTVSEDHFGRNELKLNVVSFSLNY